MPNFRLQPEWTIVRGAGHGLKEAHLLGRIEVGDVSVGLVRTWDALVVAMSGITPSGQEVNSPNESAGHVLVRRFLHWMTALQRNARMPVFDECAILSTEYVPGRRAVFHLAVPFAAPDTARRCMEWLSAAIDVAMTPQANQDALAVRFADLRTFLGKFEIKGVNTLRFLDAANKLDIPIRRLDARSFMIGQGRHSRWLESSFTDRTGVIGSRLARDKLACAHVLKQSGLPGPRHLRVGNIDQALEAATQLGYPVVVKPRDLDQGLGVAANLNSAAEVAEAFAAARRHSPNVLVEKHFSGNDYRLTVFEGRLIKATLRVPGGVQGDGLHSVGELVERAQQDRQQARRARERGRPLLTLDAEALGLLTQAGLSPQSVPAAGSHVPLRRRANLSAGGTSIAVELQDVHPDNRRLAERAAGVLRLDLAGIDLLIPDIGQSWLKTGALICEVNAQPQIGIGTSPHIYEDILLELVGRQARIPLLLVLADGRPADLPWLYRTHPGAKGLGLSSRWGISEQGLQVTAALQDDWVAGQALLTSSSVDMGIIVMSAREAGRTGLPSDLFDAVLLADTPGNREISGSGWASLWQLVLPHVRRGLLAPEAMRHALPAATVASRHDLITFGGTDAAHCLAQALDWLNTLSFE